MIALSQVNAALRRQNRKNYLLLVLCNFISVLLITAYVTMMRSPTVLQVLPEGGDSRKQVMMIFVLAVIGCGVFTTYAASLFFRSKARETGIFLALGATRQTLSRQMFRELAQLGIGSCALGALLGTPLAWLLWQGFRLLLVDSQEMAFAFDPQACLFALAFSLFTLAMLFWLGRRSLRRTNIIDIVNEARRSEPIRDVKRWYGPVGILLLAIGGLLGYQAPSFFILQLQWYPPEGFTAIFYLPALVGLYMILLHTVVNGWHQGKNRYKHLISTSMMRFQGRQTVRNMLVITVLLAGAYFASFYTPMLSAGNTLQVERRPYDYAYHYRADQELPGQGEVEQLAEEYGVTITGWKQQPMAVLAVDGEEHVEKEGPMGATWEAVYREQLHGDTFLSESAYRTLTGQDIQLEPGTVVGVFDDEGSSNGMMGNEISLVTNMVTGAQLEVTPVEPVLCYDLLFGCRVLDDGDYANITQGLTPQWQEQQVFFNVEDVDGTYDFAKALFNAIVDRSGPEVEVGDYYDPVEKAQAEAAGEPYAYAPQFVEEHGMEPIRYDQRDSSAFRVHWKYMPSFRVLDRADFVTTMAVFLMLFLFIAIVCFAAVLVIGYTRCLTIALNNRQVFEDLRRLGATPHYLYQVVRGQVSRVFFVPGLTGTTLIYAFYMLILYFNGDPLGFSAGELAGMGNCLLLVAALSLLLYGFYRFTLGHVCRMVGVDPASRKRDGRRLAAGK